ncbi:MAG: tRNA1(Val) (adenine(37)-N6)-methyltransferase [Chitinophagaceae bacterium]
MAKPFFQFKQFTVFHNHCAMKVTTDGCLFGAWIAKKMSAKSWKGKNMLDIGAGSGLLSLMIAQQNDIFIDAVEIDVLTAGQALDNFSSSPFRNNFKIINSDILNFRQGGYDCIISNPPFYEAELTSPAQQKNIAHHSIQLGWGELISVICQKLKDDGNFFLLLPFKRKKEMEILLEAHQLFINEIVIVQQSDQHLPFRCMIRGSKKTSALVCSELSICDDKKQYTQAFVQLLKDYYLYL